MKKQDIIHFFDEHKTELICLGVGIGIGAYAMYGHHFGPIRQDVTHVVLGFGGSCAVQQTPVAKEAIEELLKEVGNDGHIMWWIEKL